MDKEKITYRLERFIELFNHFLKGGISEYQEGTGEYINSFKLDFTCGGIEISIVRESSEQDFKAYCNSSPVKISDIKRSVSDILFKDDFEYKIDMIELDMGGVIYDVMDRDGPQSGIHTNKGLYELIRAKSKCGQTYVFDEKKHLFDSKINETVRIMNQEINELLVEKFKIENPRLEGPTIYCWDGYLGAFIYKAYIENKVYGFTTRF